MDPFPVQLVQRLVVVECTLTCSVNKLLNIATQVFFDLESALGDITELCIKEGPALTEAQVRGIRDDVKVGDKVLARGRADPSDPKAILLASIAVTTRWADVHPGEHFVPRCALKASEHTDSKALQVCQRFAPQNVSVRLGHGQAQARLPHMTEGIPL